MSAALRLVYVLAAADDPRRVPHKGRSNLQPTVDFIQSCQRPPLRSLLMYAPTAKPARNDVTSLCRAAATAMSTLLLLLRGLEYLLTNYPLY